MIRRNLWILNIAFLLGFSYFVADLINLFIGRQLDRATPSPSVAITTTPEVEVKPAAELYSSIVERNIFGIQPSAAIATPEEMVQSPVQLPPLRVRLVGTIAGEPEESLAILEDTATKEQRLYRLRDWIEADAQLIEITRNEISLLRGGTHEVLYIEEENASGPSSTATPAAFPPISRSAVSPNSWVLDKQEVTAALENLPQLLTKARVVPNLGPDGKNNGFRVVSIAPASFYEKIGLRNGDVLQRINGIDVGDPETFMRVFTQLKEESRITLDVLRNNQKESFNYEIR